MTITTTKSNIPVIGVQEGKEKEGRAEKALEVIMAKTFQTWQETENYRFKKPSEPQTKKFMPKHIIIKHLKTKDKEKYS